MDLNSETQPRLVPPPVPVEPAPSAISQDKLEWAQTQTRVPTPPLGTPAASDEFEDEPTEFGPKPDVGPASSGSDLDFDEGPDESTAIRPRPKLPVDEDVSSSVTNLPNAESGGSAGRKLIAVLLLVIAGLFGAAVWKKQQDARRVGTVTPVVVDEPDAGAEEPAVVEVLDAGSIEEAIDAGDAELADEGDAGEGEEESDDGGEAEEPDVADAGPNDAGPTDAGPKKVVKKKPPKRKRRR